MIRATRDAAEVGAILNHPEVRRHFVGGEQEQDYTDLLTRAHALVDDGCCIIFDPVGDGVYAAHIGMVPSCRGKVAADACRDACAWAWNSLPDADVLLGSIRADNYPARRLAVHVGFRAVGQTDEVWHDGVSRRVAHYALERP